MNDIAAIIDLPSSVSRRLAREVHLRQLDARELVDGGVDDPLLSETGERAGVWFACGLVMDGDGHPAVLSVVSCPLAPGSGRGPQRRLSIGVN
jgi:hypothetical protein